MAVSAVSTAHLREIRITNSPATHQKAWLVALSFIFAVTVLRLIYLIWFCPYQLVGDEAYYWEQARHLDLCYNEKGPALPWLIYFCCHIFGDTEWAVRLPVVVSFALAAWGVGRLAIHITNGNRKAGLIAVICFCLLPAFQANAQICTQDGPLIAIWIALTAIGLRLLHRWRDGRSTWGEWLLLWFTIGIGFLFKQSILLFLCSFPIYWITQRKKLPLRPVFFLQQIVGVILFLGIISPMIIWNQRHGWPMLAHTLGHLGVGGDQAGRINRGNAIVWLASTLGGILGAIGPACIALMIWACWHAFRARREDSTRWQDRLWLMCAAWPSILFFVFLSFIKPVVPSWPLPSFVPLVALLADVLVSEFDQRMRNSKSAVSLRRGWNALIIYGIGGWLVLSFPTVLSHLPVVGARFEKSIIRRFTGHREAAAELRSVLENLKTPDGRAPLVVTRHYMQAALDCFYLPDHPVIYTAGKYLGKRSTTFDQWPDTNLENPALYGRTLLLDGEGDIPWERALIFDKREPVTNEYFIAANYRGPQPNYLGSNGEPTDE